MRKTHLKIILKEIYYNYFLEEENKFNDFLKFNNNYFVLKKYKLK